MFSHYWPAALGDLCTNKTFFPDIPRVFKFQDFKHSSTNNHILQLWSVFSPLVLDLAFNWLNS